MKTAKVFLIPTALLAALTAITHVRADDFAAAAAKVSAIVKGPVVASPHGLEDFPWALESFPPPARISESVRIIRTYPDDLAAAAAEASAYVKRPIAASPHALEEFPWALCGYPPPQKTHQPARKATAYPGNLAGAAAKASALIKSPVDASPHGLEDFPWLLWEISD
jgi:hypothetical protein